MNFSVDDIRATNIRFAENRMWVSLNDGRIMAVPLSWFPKLECASIRQLEEFEISGGGIGLHWDGLNEDISVPDLVLGRGARDVKSVPSIL